MKLSGRVSDAASKQLVAKQLSALEDTVPRFDMETGQIRSKKAKKQKSPNEQAQADLKQFDKKILPIVNLFIRFGTHISHKSSQARVPNFSLLQ